MIHADSLIAILAADPVRMRILRIVASIGLPGAWVAAGFVRSAVWDHLHGREASQSWSDIDVIWFDPDDTGEATDKAAERTLLGMDGALNWSVKNQARMHRRNRHPPYASATDAMRYWPETATAVAARVSPGLEIAAPLGLADLFGLRLAPGPAARRTDFLARIHHKRWQERWPRLSVDAD